MKKNYCYILRNSYGPDINKTYNGFTNCPSRRIRQHNQEITGGAIYTKKYGNKSWEIYAIMTGFPDVKNALQCEWIIKHPDNKRRTVGYKTPRDKIIGLNKILRLNKWTNNSAIETKDLNLELWIVQEYADLLVDLPGNIKTNVVDVIDLNAL